MWPGIPQLWQVRPPPPVAMPSPIGQSRAKWPCLPHLKQPSPPPPPPPSLPELKLRPLPSLYVQFSAVWPAACKRPESVYMRVETRASCCESGIESSMHNQKASCSRKLAALSNQPFTLRFPRQRLWRTLSLAIYATDRRRQRPLAASACPVCVTFIGVVNSITMAPSPWSPCKTVHISSCQI
jgi:hypothetical protein